MNAIKNEFVEKQWSNFFYLETKNGNKQVPDLTRSLVVIFKEEKVLLFTLKFVLECCPIIICDPWAQILGVFFWVFKKQGIWAHWLPEPSFFLSFFLVEITQPQVFEDHF